MAQLDNNVFWLIKRVFARQQRAVEAAMRANGVSGTHAGILSQLLNQPGISVADIARRLLITPQAATVAAAALEKRGLIERSPDPHHGRILRCFLTKDGRRVGEACVADAIEVEKNFLAALPPDQQQNFAQILTMLLAETAPPASNGATTSGRGRARAR